MSHAKRSESLDRLRSARPIDLKVVRMCLRTAEALLTPLRIFLTGYPRLTQGLRKAYAALTCIRGLSISLNYIVAHM